MFYVTTNSSQLRALSNIAFVQNGERSWKCGRPTRLQPPLILPRLSHRQTPHPIDVVPFHSRETLRTRSEQDVERSRVRTKERGPRARLTLHRISFSRPEGLGVVCGTVYLVAMFSFIPFPFLFAWLQSGPHPFPHEQVNRISEGHVIS